MIMKRADKQKEGVTHRKSMPEKRTHLLKMKPKSRPQGGKPNEDEKRGRQVEKRNDSDSSLLSLPSLAVPQLFSLYRISSPSSLFISDPFLFPCAVSGVLAGGTGSTRAHVERKNSCGSKTVGEGESEGCTRR